MPNHSLNKMILFSIRVFILTWLSSVVCVIDNEEFYVLLCAADEDIMEDIFDTCEVVLRDSVDGCLIKCFIELRNKRAPTTRIDEKYYQFVFCDTALNTEWANCAVPCVKQLKISYDGFENIAEWNECMAETVENYEYKIEHQDDPEPPKGGNDPQGGNNPKGGKGSGNKKGGGSGSKVKPKKKNVTKDNSKANNKGNPKGQGKGNDPKVSNRKSKLKMRINNV